MIHGIIEGISTALYEEFGEGYRIYANDIKQGLKEPCFFISCINPENRMFFNKRYYQKHLFCIQYFPENNRQECNAIADRLFSCLEYITADNDLIRGDNMHSEFTDGVLHFFVNYDFFVKAKGEDIPKMEVLEHGTKPKK